MKDIYTILGDIYLEAYIVGIYKNIRKMLIN